MRFTAFCFLVVMAFAQSAQAQEAAKELTRQNISEFITKITAMTSSSMNGMDATTVAHYLQLHISDDAVFKSRMSYSMPGQEAQDNQMTLTKEDFITGLNSGTQALSDYEASVKIKKVKIAKDKKTASIVTETRDVVTMPVQDENDLLQQVPLEGLSTCNQTLALDQWGLIQMTSADCVTKIEFQPY